MKKLLLPAVMLVLALIAAFAGENLSRRFAAPASSTAAGSVAPSPLPGLWQGDISVSLRPSEPSHGVVYSTDGSVPTAAVGLPYTKPMRLSADTPGMAVIRAVEVLPGAGDEATTGPVVSVSYGVGLAPQLPVISLIAEPSDLWGTAGGLLTNPSFRGDAWERSVHVTGFLSDTATFALPAGLRVDGREPLNAAKQTLRLYFRAEYGAPRLQAALYPEHPYQAEEAQSFKRLLLQAGEHGVTWSLLSDQVLGHLAAQLGLPAAQGRFVWLFINGSSWGLYRLTERVDRFMVSEDSRDRCCGYRAGGRCARRHRRGLGGPCRLGGVGRPQRCRRLRGVFGASRSECSWSTSRCSGKSSGSRPMRSWRSSRREGAGSGYTRAERHSTTAARPTRAAGPTSARSTGP